MTESKFKYEYKDRIVFKYYFGLVTVEDVRESWLSAINQNLFPDDVIGFVLDYRKAKFDIAPGRHNEIPEFYHQHPEVFEGTRVAIVTVRPEDVVYPMLIRMKDKGYQSIPFSTIEAAINWVSGL
ncbi:hypothetical protein [Draconibacterium halophilum]|uniref:STAS/SEC14 domain-containing protein n=1 Tax=Draconibacterium halophilum TaxID=2706887 RepID=A0A6C0RG14_9BACT|nr:hypothetical protein [Draconibacterium halophilum]QIA09007.1 hypothetical protein G0Q07_15365 [Draconibacterium halophilum]